MVSESRCYAGVRRKTPPEPEGSNGMRMGFVP